MQRIFRSPRHEKRVNHQEAGKTPEGEKVQTQVETCGREFRLLIVIGIELVWTHRYPSVQAAMDFIGEYMDELAHTAAPAFA